jgi:hypothetical protein
MNGPSLAVGTLVELLAPLPLRPRLKPGARGRVVRLAGYWDLVEVRFEGEPRPCLMRAARLRRVDGSPEGAR